MADGIQGYATFPGVQFITKASYTLSHGITPGVCTIECLPQVKPIKPVDGKLTFFFGPTKLEFKNFKPDLSSLQRSPSGLVVGLQLLDKRWRWKFGDINGEYNLRDKRRSIVGPRKNAVQLAEILLNALGEEDYSTDGLSTKDYPYVNWESDYAATALADLCESLGCSIVLKTNGKVSIEQRGVGKQLPQLQTLISEGPEINPPEKPGRIIVVGAPNRYQYKLPMEAVALDYGRIVKPVDYVSYMPEEGWGKRDPYALGLPNGESLRLALGTVWRWYRVRLQPAPYDSRHGHPVEDFFEVMTPDGELIRDLNDILPVSSELLTTLDVVDPSGYPGTSQAIPERKQAAVWGVYYLRNLGEPLNSNEIRRKNANGSYTDTVSARRPYMFQYNGDFELLEDFAIVVFPEPVVKWSKEKEEWQPADLWIECTFNRRVGPEKATYDKYDYTFKLPGTKDTDGSEIVKKEQELQLQWLSELSPGGKANHWRLMRSRDLLDQDANFYAELAAAKYENVISRENSYAGIVKIDPDGAIQQVSWSVSADSPTITRASRNSEHSIYVPDYRERRFFESMQGLRRNVNAVLPQLPKLNELAKGVR